MSDTKPLIDRLDHLGEQLRQRPSVTGEVMQQVQPGPVLSRAKPEPTRAFRHWSGRLLVAATAACVLAVVALWPTRPTSLYAQTAQALERVKTIHVTGWTTQLVRKWPLESPPQAAANDSHVVDGWYWYDDDNPRSLEIIGPLVLARDGNQLREYQSDADLLFVAESNPKDYVERFSTISEYLRLLRAEGMQSQDLGTRTDNGRQVHGVRIYRGSGPVEFWFDVETQLPIQISQVSNDANDTEVLSSLKFAYDQPVPETARTFAAPKTTHVRYGHGKDDQVLVWNRHVQDIGQQLAESAPQGPVTIVPRTLQRTFSYQYSKQTPEGHHWVLPLDQNQYTKLTVRNFIRLRVQTDTGQRSAATWRIDPELLDLEFPRSDLVYKDGTPWQEWVQFALQSVGLEYVDVQETRTFWIAQHDGRKRRSWKAVKPPVPYLVEGGETKRGVVRPGIGHQLTPATMSGLFHDFHWMQNNDYRADHPIIVDQTGLPRPPEWNRDQYSTFQEFKHAVDYDQYYVASDSPWFVGDESLQMARDWYQNELGVTFQEEEREVTTHVIRRIAD